MTIKCSLCEQVFEIDDLINIRKQRHEEKHLRTKGISSQRDGHPTTNSSTKGKVEWIEI